MTVKVNIGEQDSVCVERLWYEYNAALGVLRYLMSQSDVLEKIYSCILIAARQKV